MPSRIGQDRFVLQRDHKGLVAILPTRKHWLSIFFLCLWLVFWLTAEVAVIKELVGHTSRRSPGFMIFWLVFWTLGGIWASLFLLWQLVGTEVLRITSTTLSQRIQVFRLGITRQYPLDAITGLRVVHHDPSGYRRRRTFIPPLLGKGNGAIAFEYDRKAVYLGASLDETEAAKLVTALTWYLPGRL
ncbi:hypothetical protein [Chitinimonas naiadis]